MIRLPHEVQRVPSRVPQATLVYRTTKIDPVFAYQLRRTKGGKLIFFRMLGLWSRISQRRAFALDRRFRQKTKIDTTKIPYALNRTASGNLPVYSRVRGIDRETVTYVESIYGDTTAFVADLRMTVCGDAPISEKGRSVEISGRFVKPIKNWLLSLGF